MEHIVRPARYELSVIVLFHLLAPTFLNVFRCITLILKCCTTVGTLELGGGEGGGCVVPVANSVLETLSVLPVVDPVLAALSSLGSSDSSYCVSVNPYLWL